MGWAFGVSLSRFFLNDVLVGVSDYRLSILIVTAGSVLAGLESTLSLSSSFVATSTAELFFSCAIRALLIEWTWAFFDWWESCYD